MRVSKILKARRRTLAFLIGKKLHDCETEKIAAVVVHELQCKLAMSLQEDDVHDWVEEAGFAADVKVIPAKKTFFGDGTCLSQKLAYDRMRLCQCFETPNQCLCPSKRHCVCARTCMSRWSIHSGEAELLLRSYKGVVNPSSRSNSRQATNRNIRARRQPNSRSKMNL